MILTEDMLPPPHTSWWQVASKLPEARREEFLRNFQDSELAALGGDWFIHARREQIAPIWDWFVWVIMAGRGFGKNYSGSNWLIDQHLMHGTQNSCIIAATASDLRKYCIEGPSGVLSLAPKHFYPEYIPSKTILIWPNDTTTHLYSSEKPRRIRGGNYEKAWCDELSWWSYPEEVWDMLMFALRKGDNPQAVVTMTPRPIPLVKDLLKREGLDVAVTRGSTLDNKDNLAKTFMKTILDQYGNTRLGRQEIEGELLSDVEGALWNHAMLDLGRLEAAPSLVEIVVAVDPSTTGGEKADEAGITVSGRDVKSHGYVLADHSLRASPNTWAQKAVWAYEYYKANRIIAEKNQGGEMISSMIHNINGSIPVKLVHASKGKAARAEPVAALYEQGKVSHVGVFQILEDEMCAFVPGDIIGSPNRVDSLVWGLTEILVNPRLRAGTWGRKRAA